MTVAVLKINRLKAYCIKCITVYKYNIRLFDQWAFYVNQYDNFMLNAYWSNSFILCLCHSITTHTLATVAVDSFGVDNHYQPYCVLYGLNQSRDVVVVILWRCNILHIMLSNVMIAAIFLKLQPHMREQNYIPRFWYCILLYAVIRCLRSTMHFMCNRF